MIENWWDETERAILHCLRHGGPMSPGELGRRIGASDGEATAFLTLLIGAGKVRLRLVELTPAESKTTRPAGSRNSKVAQPVGS